METQPHGVSFVILRGYIRAGLKSMKMYDHICGFAGRVVPLVSGKWPTLASILENSPHTVLCTTSLVKSLELGSRISC